MDTDFLLGAGLAFLIVVLGWGDQIRGTQEKILTQEREYLNTLRLKWGEVQALFRDSGDQTTRLAALLRLIGRESVANVVNIQLVADFEKLAKIRAILENMYRRRFNLVLAASVCMLVFGLLSVRLSGAIGPGVSWEGIYFTISFFIIFLIMGFTVSINIFENSLRKVLQEIEDNLRLAVDEKATTASTSRAQGVDFETE